MPVSEALLHNPDFGAAGGSFAHVLIVSFVFYSRLLIGGCSSKLTIGAEDPASSTVSKQKGLDEERKAGLASSTPDTSTPPKVLTDKEREKLLYPGRVNLTTYPDQHCIAPQLLQWGASDATTRGSVICSRLPSSIKQRNAIGAHSGSYSVYRAIAIAMGTLNPRHKPDYSMTEPPLPIPPNPTWTEAEELGLDIRPSIAVTKAHLKMSELDEAPRRGDLVIDGTIVLKSRPVKNVDGSVSDVDPGVEVTVSKAAVEPVWYLPGIAERFRMYFGESPVRCLVRRHRRMYPELITRPDIKVFLPPIGGLTVYIFGNPPFVSDESKELTLRVHDECNSSDVFGSDICTCKPYLTFAIEECIRGAQKGGVGVVVYFHKEGRALGDVTNPSLSTFPALSTETVQASWTHRCLRRALIDQIHTQ
ncbi:hypothetical protein NLJ89_g6642 [Agrocybe chaxingu]|uniref:Uncharacterized protein n=1 Tax=Agrocybe chaxingu TaxID=84603 RepID=A0A9W8JYD0_9AGAR|nr:hypothetical protein NLJ89_g6642 [Agrocybe chaxingu]